jgi:hypothetical protein
VDRLSDSITANGTSQSAHHGCASSTSAHETINGMQRESQLDVEHAWSQRSEATGLVSSRPVGLVGQRTSAVDRAAYEVLADGKQRSIKAADLRRASGDLSTLNHHDQR